MDSEIYSKYEIIDSHTHIFPEKMSENATVAIGKFYDLPMRNCGSSINLIESGKKIGVSKYLVCSAATTPHQISSINNFIAEECRLHPEFVGLGTTHPNTEDLTGDIEQIKKLGLKGVKLHPDFQTFEADSKEAFRIYEQIEGVLPLLIHCGDPRFDYSSPRRIANICKNFPKLKLQASHLGGWEQWEEALECLSGFENVLFDTCSSVAFLPKEVTVKMIRTYGVENCAFGTDFPMWKHDDELELLLGLGFTEEENRLILAENFKRFMNIE